jgi:hypothetical protein
MNDKDKEAFEKWFETDARSLFYGIEDIWKAACEYKQKEIDFLKDRNETNISKVTCINQVNDGLHILLKEAEAENKKLREALEHESKKRKILQDGMEFIASGGYYTEHVAEETLEKLKEAGEA